MNSALLFLVVALLAIWQASAVHDSFNFELLPMRRECFFEDFDKNTPVKTVEAFVQSGGNLDVLLTMHGPLDLADIRSVRRFLPQRRKLSEATCLTRPTNSLPLSIHD